MYRVWHYGYDGRMRGKESHLASGPRVLRSYADAIGTDHGNRLERIERVWQNGKRGVALTFRNGPVLFVRHA